MSLALFEQTPAGVSAPKASPRFRDDRRLLKPGLSPEMTAVANGVRYAGSSAHDNCHGSDHDLSASCPTQMAILLFFNLDG